MKLTLSVRSFHVPATPGTCAWPPRFPSVPDLAGHAGDLGRERPQLIDHRVDRLGERRHLALGVDVDLAGEVAVGDGRGDVAMLRTWVVRFDAIRLTFSVSPFQVPDTPSTSAWPPSMPSVPTSRATRVTSAANDRSWSTIVLIVSFSSRISPRASTVIFLDRSPWATAVVTCAMLRTWSVRFDAMKLTLSVRSARCPDTPVTSAWPPSLPSVPTSRATRVTSSAKADSWSTIVFIVRLSSRTSPLTSTVIFWDRSPLATAVVTWAMLRTWSVRFDAMKFTLSVRSFQVPATPGTSAWPPSLPSVPTSRATRVTSVGERRELVHHRVDGVLQLQDLAARVDRDLLRQVAVGDRGGHLGDVADLVGQVARHEVHVVGQVLPRARRRPAPPPDRRACPRCRPRGPRGSPRRRTTAAGRPSC